MLLLSRPSQMEQFPQQLPSFARLLLRPLFWLKTVVVLPGEARDYYLQLHWAVAKMETNWQQPAKRPALSLCQ